MKASWSGYLNLGELTVPIQLFTAVQSVGPRFVQLHAHDHSPIKRIYKCEAEGEEITADEIIRAVPHQNGYIEITESDLERGRATSKDIIVRQFSEPEAINPKYYDKPYYVVPGKGGELAYSLLRQAFERAKKIAVVTFGLHDKEHIGIMAPDRGILMLQQLRFEDEIAPRSNVRLPSLPQPDPDQVDLAISLMDRYSAPFYVEDYRNEQSDRLVELVDRKAKGLRPKRQAKISSHTTTDSQLDSVLKAMLHDQSSQTLKEPEATA